MSRNFTGSPLFSKKSNAVHPFEEMRYYVISIANKRHCMKMRTCITFLWWWKIFFFSQLFLWPIVGGQVTPVRSHEKRPLEVTWVGLALGSTCFEQQPLSRWRRDISWRSAWQRHRNKGQDKEIAFWDGLDKDTVHPGGTSKEEGGGRKKGDAILWD